MRATILNGYQRTFKKDMVLVVYQYESHQMERGGEDMLTSYNNAMSLNRTPA